MEKKQTVFRKVMVKDRLPKFEGDEYHSSFITDGGVVGFDKITGWEDYYDPYWWLEEIELPSEEELRREADEHSWFADWSAEENIAHNTGFNVGANYILNKLK